MNSLLDWSVRAFRVGAKYILLSNTRSLDSVVLGAAVSGGIARFAERVVGVVRAILAGSGCATTVGATDELDGEKVRLAKALNRTVTGSMNELVTHATVLLTGGELPLPQVNARLNDVFLLALACGTDRYGTPQNAFAKLIAAECA